MDNFNSDKLHGSCCANHDHDHGQHHEHHHGGCHCHEHAHNHEHGEGGGTSFLAPALSFLMLLSGIILKQTAPWFHDSETVQLIWYIIAFLPVGWPVMKEAWESMMEKDFFNEFTLMVIACIGAFCIREFPEAVGVMLFYTVGETLQHKAVERATNNISGLLDLRSEVANVVTNGEVTAVNPKEVAVGSILEVRPGERVPLDGVLESDEGVFDTSALTGESMPRNLHKGEDVLAGMISSSGTVRIRVTKEYAQSALSRILELVEEASDRKAPAELFIRKFARIYTPIVIGLAALTVVVPWLVSLLNPSFTYIFDDWFYRALVFLVISCPCALVISVPLGYFAGIGAASKAGILFKGGNYLEAITHIDTVAFDKTGTLTTGEFAVTGIVPEGITSDRLLSYLAAAERNSLHPLAKAIVAYAKRNGIGYPNPTSMSEVAGHGVKAMVDGDEVTVGNAALLEKEGIALPHALKSVNETIIACGVNGKFAGYVTLGDTVKPDAAEAVKELHRLGIERIVMLSGDREETVKEYASRLGIKEAYGNLLPADKAEFVSSAINDRKSRVAFVGDGINDAPVLTLSNVGIAMGGLGADAAIESADVVIQTDSPAKVAEAISIGRFTRKIITENIIGAIAVKVAVLVLGFLGIASLWGAVFADVGVALLAVLNSMRIMWRK